MTPRTLSVPLLLMLLISACSSPQIKDASTQHLRPEGVSTATNSLPPPVMLDTSPPPTRSPVAKAETYSVVVNNVNVHELLFALARDAKLNVDIHSGISGTVTLNAIDQTLPQLLNRIAKQVDMRFELDGPNLTVMRDTPYLRNYVVDYVNMSRDTTGKVSVTTQLSAVAAAGSGGSTGGSGNNSTTSIENKAQHHFWETLIKNINDILRETDKEIVVSRRSAVAQEQANRSGATTASTTGSGAVAAASGATGQSVAGTGTQSAQTQAEHDIRAQSEREFKDYQTILAAAVIAHPETGIVTVRATSRQHVKIQEFIDKVVASARRQVMIEATIVEVQLSDNYQQGIDWNLASFGAAGFRFIQKATTGANVIKDSLLEIGYKNSEGNLSGSVKLLEAFGNIKVLSSPKLSVLNNQSAVLKVVDNSVYFTIKADTTQNQTTTVITYTTNLHQVPVGFVMNITPQISDNDQVILNIRPSISRIVGYAADPNPALRAAGVVNEVPIIRSREMESVIRIQNGNIAVMGGLMEDALDNQNSGTSGLSRLPGIGELFNHRNNTARKTELVVFLRPQIIRSPSVADDYAGLRDTLPGDAFFSSASRSTRPAVSTDGGRQ